MIILNLFAKKLIVHSVLIASQLLCILGTLISPCLQHFTTLGMLLHPLHTFCTISYEPKLLETQGRYCSQTNFCQMNSWLMHYVLSFPPYIPTTTISQYKWGQTPQTLSTMMINTVKPCYKSDTSTANTSKSDVGVPLRINQKCFRGWFNILNVQLVEETIVFSQRPPRCSTERHDIGPASGHQTF